MPSSTGCPGEDDKDCEFDDDDPLLAFSPEHFSRREVNAELHREIASIDRPDDRLAIDDFGLSLAEAKAMLTALQAAITEAQALAHVRRDSGRARAAVEPGG